MKSFEGKEITCVPPNYTKYFLICDITSINISDKKKNFKHRRFYSYTKKHTVNQTDYAMATFK